LQIPSLSSIAKKPEHSVVALVGDRDKAGKVNPLLDHPIFSHVVCDLAVLKSWRKATKESS
jgi:hypothetical protein